LRVPVYRAASIFWVPEKAGWPHLKGNAPQATIGTIVDEATAEIERGNRSLKAVLPKDYARLARVKAENEPKTPDHQT
jgi:type I restriction enzyme M protein